MSDRDMRARLLAVLAELDQVSRRILERDAAEGGTAAEDLLARELGLDGSEVCRLRITARTDVEQCLGQPWEDLLADAGYPLKLTSMSSTEHAAEGAAGHWRVLTEEQSRTVRQELNRRMAENQSPTRARLRWSSWALLGIAASAMAAIALWKWGTSADAAMEMTALANPPRGDELRYFMQELELGVSQIPMGFGLKGNPTEQMPGMAADAWLPIGRAAEHRRVERAFERASEIQRGGRFTLCFRSSREVVALAVWVLEDGTIDLIYPQAGGLPERFIANEIHTLPREPMVLVTGDSQSPSLNYDPGFTVPFGQDRILVLLALRSDPVDEELLSSFKSELERWNKGRQSQADALPQVADALRGQGFVVRQFEVSLE